MKQEVKIIFLSLFSGLIGSVIFISLYTHTYQKSFGTVRMDQILRHHIEEYGKKELSSDERDMAAKKFARFLEATINEISQKERIILLVAPATVTKLPDYTDRIETEIKRYLETR